MTHIRYLLEWALVVLARKTLGLLPWRAAVAIGAATGAVAYRLAIRRRVVLANLAQAFPQWSASECRRMAHCVYRNAGRTLIECLLLETLSPDKMNQLVEGVEGLGFLEQLVATHRPLIVVTGHMGNWELMGAYFARQGYRLKVFAKPLHNPRLEADLLAARRSLGLDVIYTGEGLKPALRHLHEEGVLVFLADQDARRAGIAIPFFGAPASTALGPAVFAYLARAPIVPVFALRIGAARHRCTVLAPIEPVMGEKREAALERLTRAHVEALEQVVRKHPDQYFWFHRRWKTRVEKLVPTQAKNLKRET
jgi:KDO2-lipid IV(A) lauroyltransferase